MKCFVCQPVERIAETPHIWRPVVTACRRHRSGARLPDERLLGDLVAEAGFPLDGALLSFVLNPVTIDGTKGWVEWQSGEVWAELFASSSYFEFQVQHRHEDLDALYRLHRRRKVFGAGPSMAGLVSYLCQSGPLAEQELRRLSELWWIDRACRTELEQRRVESARSPHEAVEILRRVGSPSLSHDDLVPALDALLRVADRRFSSVG